MPVGKLKRQSVKILNFKKYHRQRLGNKNQMFYPFHE
jgi:hypothetical protein